MTEKAATQPNLSRKGQALTVDELLSTVSEKGSAEENEESQPFDLRQLFEVIFKKLHPLFGIDCAVLVIYDADLSRIVNAYVSTAGISGSPDAKDMVDSPVVFSAIAREVSCFQFPVLKSKANWIEEQGENHAGDHLGADYMFHCYIPLEVDDQILGTLELHNHSKELSAEGLTFCCNIADLLAELIPLINKPAGNVGVNRTAAAEEAAPVNTVATELIEKYYNLLLSMSNTIAGIKDRKDFREVVARELKQFSFLSHYLIATINPDGESHSVFMFDDSDLLMESPEFLGIYEQKYPVHDGVFDETLKAQSALIFDIGKLMKREHVPAYVHFWREKEMKQIVGIALRSGGEDLGVLCVHYHRPDMITHEEQLFLKAIAAQLSIALAKAMAEEEKIYEPEEAPAVLNYGDIIGCGQAMQQVFNLLNKVSDSETTVLVLGETGTGKELIAKAIHDQSPRKNKTMVKVNCAAIPPNLIESELFGHEKGSFTGATERRIGKFELANNGTLFLDEIGELSLELQVKLLRVLQEKEIERVGGKTTIMVDVRIISATNRDLLEEVEAGRFRTDLFYRLNVFPISLPPLRKRKDDIPLLAQHFLSGFTQRSGRRIEGFSKKVLTDMMKYHWPGNVRELEHLIERQVLLTRGNIIRELEIPSAAKAELLGGSEFAVVKTIAENERDHIFSVLKQCNGKISGRDGAAKLLGVPATTLNSKIKRLGLSKKHII